MRARGVEKQRESPLRNDDNSSGKSNNGRIKHGELVGFPCADDRERPGTLQDGIRVLATRPDSQALEGTFRLERQCCYLSVSSFILKHKKPSKAELFEH